MSRTSAVLAGGFVGAASVALLARRGGLRWGATDDEVDVTLPGDDLITDPHLTATRAITIHRRADEVWPWIAQLGQGRGGFYSYEWLENLAGCDIHNADRIVAQWQDVRVGDEVRLHPDVALDVVVVEPERALVLRGAVAPGEAPPPYDFTWAFVLTEQDGATRLIVRERYGYETGWARLLVEPVQIVSFVMTQRMLRGIRDRAEDVVAA